MTANKHKDLTKAAKKKKKEAKQHFLHNDYCSFACFFPEKNILWGEEVLHFQWKSSPSAFFCNAQ